MVIIYTLYFVLSIVKQKKVLLFVKKMTIST